MSRKFSCLLLTVAMIISSIVIVSAVENDTAAQERAAAYQAAAEGVSTVGVRSSATTLVTDDGVLGLPIETGVLADSEGLRLDQLTAISQTKQDDAIRNAEEAAAKAAERKAILAAYDGVMIVSDSGLSVRSGPGTAYPAIRSIANGKVAHLVGADGDWFEVSFGSATGYVEAGGCNPVNYVDYDGTAATSTVREDLVAYARTFIGTPYRYGGASRSGTDCSGFTMQVFAQFGYSLPHGASDQYYRSTAVTSQERQAGDLVFFNTEGGISHVGIYIGGGAFIHASTSSGVTIDYLGESYYAARYLGAGRIINE
jgi:cell wall-associated NlpC family hydrolase